MKDHCHYTGKCCGATLQYKELSFIPVMTHNISGFDGHLVLLKTWKIQRMQHFSCR